MHSLNLTDIHPTWVETTAVLGNQVEILFGALPPLLTHVNAGKLRALAISSGKRSPAAPDVPTRLRHSWRHTGEGRSPSFLFNHTGSSCDRRSARAAW